MKKTVELIGVILAGIIFFACFCKAFHMPGGNVLLILGVVLLILPFLFLLAIHLYKEKKGNPLLLFMGAFSALIFFFGVLFVLMHWPGGFLMCMVGFPVLALVLFVMLFSEFSAKDEDRKISPLVLSLLIVCGSLLFASSFRSLAQSTINSLVVCNATFFNAAKTEAALLTVIDTPTDSLTAVVRMKSEELVAQVRELRNAMTVAAGGNSEEQDYSRAQMMDNIDIAGRMIESGKLLKLKEAIESYRMFLVANQATLKIPAEAFEMLDVRDPNGENRGMTWEEVRFKHVPVICAITHLSALELAVRNCELAVMQKENR